MTRRQGRATRKKPAPGAFMRLIRDSDRGRLAMTRRSTRIALAAAAVLACAPVATAAAASPGLAKPPAPIDPQSWVLPASMKWSDYRPIPGFNWAKDSNQPPKKLRAALVLGDFSDRRFLVSRPEGSDPIANPRGVGGVGQGKVGDFYKDLLNTPQALNHGHTINEYWLGDSYGVLGIDMDAFGPYRMDRPEYQYGLNEFGQSSACPSGETCADPFDAELPDFDAELMQKSVGDLTAAQL